MTALLLAILVANPFCSCFAARKAAHAAERGCCQVALAALAGDSEREDAEGPLSPGPVPCEHCSKKRGDWATVTLEKSMSPQWFLLAEIAWEVLPAIEGPSRGHFHGADDLPDAVKSAGRVLAQVHCRYLL